MKHYYAVFYMKSGNALVSRPFDSEKEVQDYIRESVAKEPTKVEATTYLVREQDSLRKLFGSPKSRDAVQDKKFMKSLLASAETILR